MIENVSNRIEFIYSYLVKPNKSDESYIPTGTDVPLFGDLFTFLSGIYEKSETECKIDITFDIPDDEKTENEVRANLVSMVEVEDSKLRDAHALWIALRLVQVTNKVNGPGLLFIMGGIFGGKSKIVISRFPADEGIMADEDNGNLTVQFVDKLFMKDRTSYKSVTFKKLSSAANARDGKAVDKQINDLRNPSSKYWIEDFLYCTLAVTPHAGSERFASALREVYNNTNDLDLKSTLAAAAKTLKNFKGQKKTPVEFLNALIVPSEIVIAVQQKLGRHAMTETFELNTDVFGNFFKYQSKLLHTGVMITAEVENYDDHIKEEEVGDEVRISTRGRVVNSKVQRTRANGAM